MKSKKEDPDKDKRYVVFLADVGRVKRGIVWAPAYPAGNRHVVLVNNLDAKFVASECVFTDKEAAQKYLAGEGVVRWVVCEKNMGPGVQRWERHEVPVMFQAKVIRYIYKGKYRIEDNLTLMDLKTGEIIEPAHMHSTHVYDTKKEAESDFDSRWKNGMLEAKKQLKSWGEFMELLQGNPPRSRKKAA